ncbi:hypothetical protein BOTCAL_0226g00010 [Botryotinia calthae]|uniref:Mid2 domain-containing protein n=1 Tax=Botryotinia calthae TaxID=38488 RepID=A0A4Y8D0G1_9HELO|nr:hypothetical protein BOTCAL_0226g00010 [Botryotinia calthae]
MGRYIPTLIFVIFVFYVFPIYAQTYVSSTVWIVPDGNTADLSKTYTEGITLQVTWNPVPEGYEFQTLSNLWVTTWDYDTTKFSQLLTENVNTNKSGTYDWTITIPASVLSKDAKYVLRFKDLNSAYDSSSQEVSSTGFLVINGAFSSTLTASSSPTSSTQISSSASGTAIASISATQSATQLAISTTQATPTPISTFESSGLSGSAKAGIAVGIVVVALSITGLAFLFFRRRRHAKSSSTETSTGPPAYYDPPKQPFIGNRSNVVAEIGGSERAELQGS